MTINLSVPKIEHDLKPRITVIGVGGAGGNAVNNMIRSNLEGVDFMVANTDAQAINQSLADRRIQLGVNITQGLGAGSRPDVGRAAAEEVIEQIMDQLGGSNMVFIAAGMGGGTGTGAAPVIAQAARNRGILTVGVVTKPFQFEGNHRMRIADAGIEELQQYVDTLIIIPNQNLFRVANDKTGFADAFKMADDVLHSGVRGVTDLMVMPGLVNLDFADIRTVMSEMGKAMMGTGEAEGDKRAIDAAAAAIANPLLEDTTMKGARAVLINITGGYDMTLIEVDEAATHIRNEADDGANIIFGAIIDESMKGRMRVSVVCTGIAAEAAAAAPPTRAQPVAAIGRPRPVAVPSSYAAPIAPVAVAPSQPVEAIAEPAVAMAPIDEPAAPEPIAPEPMRVAASTALPPMPEVPARQSPALTAQAAAPVRAEAYMPPRPVEPALRTEPVAEAQPLIPESVIPSTRPAAEKPRAESLFKRVTMMARTKQPAVPAGGEVKPIAAKPAQPRLGALDPADRMTPSKSDDELDIPAFLRRQAN